MYDLFAYGQRHSKLHKTLLCSKFSPKIVHLLKIPGTSGLNKYRHKSKLRFIFPTVEIHISDICHLLGVSTIECSPVLEISAHKPCVRLKQCSGILALVQDFRGK
jgi:hypothetical protein